MNNSTVVVAFIVVAAVAAVAAIIAMHYRPTIEGFSGDEVVVLESCRNMTADKLLEAYDYDIDRLSAILVTLEIPVKALRDVNSYPKIASLLVSKGLLSEEKCK